MTTRRYSEEQFQSLVYAQIERGNNTVDLIAQSLKISSGAARHRISDMCAQGKLTRTIVDRVSYYSRGEYRAHDPFFLCPQPVGDLDGLIRHSHASP